MAGDGEFSSGEGGVKACDEEGEDGEKDGEDEGEDEGEEERGVSI